MFLLAIGFVVLYRAVRTPSYRNFGLAGLLVALATYTKTTPLFLPFAMAGVLCSLRCKFRFAAIYVAVFVAALLPWMYRNYVTLGQFQFTTRGIGSNLWWGSDPRIFTSYGKEQHDAAAGQTEQPQGLWRGHRHIGGQSAHYLRPSRRYRRHDFHR